jgi:hypothetical protein
MFTRIEACRILQEIGTKKSIPELEKLALDRFGFASGAARQALDAINKRQ